MKSSQGEEKAWIGNFIQRGLTWKDPLQRGAAPPPTDDPAATRDGKTLPGQRPHPQDPRCLAKPCLKRRLHPHNRQSPTRPANGGRRPPARTTRSQTLDFTVIHPSQTRFTCPACKLTYTTHHLLIRHIDVSHARLKFNISFQCTHVNTNPHATTNHYRLTHGAAVLPPP